MKSTQVKSEPDLLERIKALESENARLRRDLMDPPADIQELVIKKLNLVSAEALTQCRVALERCVEALSFYADPETYFAIAIIPDHPCGEFADDVSDTNTDLGFRHGKKAREAIVEIAKDHTIKEFLLAKFAT